MKKINKFNAFILSIAFLSFTIGCSDFLDVNPKAVLSENLIQDPENMDGYVTAAYSYMPSLGYATSHNPWMHGSIRSDDAYKGGGGLSDQTPWYEMEIFTAVTSNVGNNDGPWYLGYCGISRCNTALRQLNAIDASVFPEKEVRIGEMRFLRGSIYFNMKLFWKYIPYIDETVEVSAEVYEGVSNHPAEMTSDMEIWERILEDFEVAIEKLPEEQPDKGRVNQIAAKAMAAKTLLFMAYEQNDRHQVVNINKDRLQKALTYLNEITDKEGQRVALCPDFAENFLPEYDNQTLESIWEVQYSINDGSTSGKVDWGDELNAPWWPPHFNCCDFHKVSYNLANAFKTDPNGLPMFDTFNNEELKGNYNNYFHNNTFDPRFSHTAAVPGHPWKYNMQLLFDSTASRAPFQYGYLNSMKEQVDPNCDCVRKPFYVQNSMNKRNIRYAEVLLWKAECLIQLDRYTEALPLINRIRQRAANSTGRLIFSDGTPLLNYKISLYQDGVNCNWTKEFAMKALQWENRLEMACEGRRFFDLLRWGILEPTMNAYFAKEKTRLDWMEKGLFIAGRDEYKPIPQAQINWSHGNYIQNPGY
ncbi:RagB/SusD family nutrient uptake outer membrane protein [Parabacteroides sp. Marseille-P3160]|uniref:RagB/SusD family nutrient uptake outer membrane protein n=1 Tax=Parabacteroides sp. Marseille-P3160 TaxID=1917887 RepID=UPI0009BA98F7|nr:RagB/SusD family nutrient uptake outer membrane protein [Parabacteroides sp. Marseille-P3160]